MNNLKLVAHRGYAAKYPENTLLAIDAAVQAGAEFVEFDILLSADKVPVLFHDRDLQRMTGQEKSIHDYTYTQLSQFSCHEFNKFGYKFVGNPITRLDELVDYIEQHPKVTIFAEVKRQAIEVFGIDTVLKKILPVLKKIEQQTVVISYSLDALLQVRETSTFLVGAVFDYWLDRKKSIIAKIKPEYVFTDIDCLPKFGKLNPQWSQLAVYECTDIKHALQVHKRGVELVETFAIGEMLADLNTIKQNDR